jgi:hypothetical protein
MRKRYLAWLLIVLSVGLMASACTLQRAQALPFKVIDEGTGFISGQGNMERTPKLLVIATPEQIDNPEADVQFPPGLAERLRELDYRHTVAIFVFRGLLSSTSLNYAVETRKVVQRGRTIIVQTHFGEPGPEQAVMMGFSSPYQVIAVPKGPNWGQKIRVVLQVDGRRVKAHTYSVP